MLALRKEEPEFISVDRLQSHLLFANLNLLLTMAWARERASLFEGDLSLLNRDFLWFLRSMAGFRESFSSRNQSGVLLLFFFGMVSMAKRIADVRLEYLLWASLDCEVGRLVVTLLMKEFFISMLFFSVEKSLRCNALGLVLGTWKGL